LRFGPGLFILFCFGIGKNEWYQQMADSESYSIEQPVERLNLRLRDLNRTLAALAGPAVFENLLFSLVFFVDTLIVGWLRNENFLAASALAGLAMFFINAPYIALAISTASIVSRSWGEGDRQTACRYAALSLTISFATAAGIAAVGYWLSEPIIRLLGASEVVLPAGSRYLKILMLSCVFGLPLFTSNSIHRSKGDVMRAMWISVLMNIVNLVSSVVLAFGVGVPKMGFYGVAWGTVLARTTGAAVSLGTLFSRRSIGLSWDHFLKPTQVMLRRLWYLAAPALAERLSNTFIYVLFMRLVAMLGTTALASHQLAVQMESFAYMPVWGLAVAATTLVGQAVGAQLEHIAEFAVRRMLAVSAVFMGILSIVFALWGPQLVRIFGSTPQVLDGAGTALRIAGLELPFMAFTFIFIGALRGAGDTKSALYVGLVSTVIFRLGGTWLLAFSLGWGLAGVWTATAADWAVRAAALFFFFRTGVWKKLHQIEKARFRE